MGAVASYILSVTATAILLGILSSFMDSKTGTGGIIRMLGGVVLLIVAIQPFVGFRFDNLTAYAEQSFLDGEAAAQEGKEQARDAMADIISEETSAYILDKAGLYRADIQVEVLLTEDEIPVPAQVTIRGEYSEYARNELKEIIEAELGIPKEHQIWIGTS